MTSNQTRRTGALLSEAQRNPRGLITTGAVMRLYARLGIAPKRATARGDLKTLARQGLITEHGPSHQRHYALRTTHQ
ncbi:hypothetical protein [Streptomyces althioticus]|uniref:hypothetical protein n=1 Tax=Streptomyces althioticus TaxID=83380 RepID=UPI00340FA5DC